MGNFVSKLTLDEIRIILGVSSRERLLWKDGKVVPVHVADELAQQAGLVHAERLVKALASEEELGPDLEVLDD